MRKILKEIKTLLQTYMECDNDNIDDKKDQWMVEMDFG